MLHERQQTMCYLTEYIPLWKHFEVCPEFEYKVLISKCFTSAKLFICL